MATTADVAAKRVALAVLEDLFVPSGRTFALRFWDGTVESPKACFEPRFTLVLKRPGALRRMLQPPMDLALDVAPVFTHGVENCVTTCSGEEILHQRETIMLACQDDGKYLAVHVTPADAAGWFDHCGYQVKVQYL